VSFQVRFTEDAENDLIRLYEFILNKEEPDWTLAARAIDSIKEQFAPSKTLLSAIEKPAPTIPSFAN
jgi:hypothetical protein